MAPLRAHAFAKLNLGLRILRRRADGYHELRTIFQTIALADRVEIEIGRGRGIQLECRSPRVSEGWFAVPAGELNLAWKAAELARREFGLRGQLRLRLLKRVPVGTGLGGGSADAAAVLRLLAGSLRRPPPPVLLWQMAAALGSDVPSFLLGGAVVGVGRGDECYPLPDLPPCHCLIALPARPIPTAEAFRLWDDAQPSRLTPEAETDTIYSFCGSLARAFPAPRRSRGRGNLFGWPFVRAGMDNDFEAVVSSLSSDFSAIRQALLRSGAAGVALTGSGAAQFALFRRRHEAERARRRVAALGPIWLTRFVSRSEFAARG